MKLNKVFVVLLVTLIACFGLTSCEKEKQPSFSGYEKIADLATLKCTFHNVAEIYNDGTDIIFGINIGYKKAWFEYDGEVELGIDASRVNIEGPDTNGVVTISIPEVQVLGLADVDEHSFSDVFSDTGLFTEIETVDQSEALKAAQQNMRERAEGDEGLMRQAKERAKLLLEQYVVNVGNALGQEYEVRFVDAA